MASILMCKNKAVYNLDEEKVLNYDLLPGLMRKLPTKYVFDIWMNIRRSENSLSVKLKNEKYGDLSNLEIDRLTYALSLSDSYWVKNEEDTVKFEEISPYFVENTVSVSNLYLQGYLPKEWIDKGVLNKYGDIQIETECHNICHICEIPCVEIKDIENGISVKNMTDVNLMLEQADMSGKIDPDDFTEEDIVRLFGLQGVQMLVIDAIVGNADRHAGNFGWLRNSDTGEYVCMAPLYDFDHALDSKLEYDRLIGDMLDCIKGDKIYEQECYRIAKIVSGLETNEIFRKRAKTILKYLEYKE